MAIDNLFDLGFVDFPNPDPHIGRDGETINAVNGKIAVPHPAAVA